MKKCILFVITLLWACISAVAQNNSFELNDECYEAYRDAEMKTGTPEFEAANSELLKRAIEKGDTKAQTLYYVMALKDATRRYRNLPATAESDNDVLKKSEDLKKIAEKLGYIQYYYYSYELAQNYFFNHGKTLQAMDMVEEMRKIAVQRKDEYGIWMGTRYIVSLYIAQNDYISAKNYIQEAIKIYETSDDPTIRRQSGTRLYCDLADTYPIGHDSVKVNLRKAEKSAMVHLDSLRINYHKAKLYAYERNIKGYEAARDFCKGDPQLFHVSTSAVELFDDIDMLVYHLPGTDSLTLEVDRLKIREVKYLANIAEHHGYKELAFEIEKKLVGRDERYLSQANKSRLSELEVKMGNTVLTSEVNEARNRVHKAMSMVMILVIIILLSVVAFFIIHTKKLKKANDKIRLANEAKTRFVQNMSHEVRTPLNAIVGFSQLLSLPDGSFSESEKSEFSGHIVNNTKMLTMLLDDILNASAMDSGNYKINYETGEMHFIAKAAITSSEHRLQPGVSMYYKPADEAPFTFTTDPSRVQQVLINLLTNACKHTPKGEIVLESSVSDGYVKYVVRDTGPGIPADQAEKIFDRFTKLNEFVQGTGLGLSICRDIASRMGAKVYLDTNYKDGSRFVFEVPVTPPDNN